MLVFFKERQDRSTMHNTHSRENYSSAELVNTEQKAGKRRDWCNAKNA